MSAFRSWPWKVLMTSTRSRSFVPEFHEVLGMDQNHPAAAGDAAVAVVQAIIGGVVLIVTADGLQDQVPVRRSQVFQRADGEAAAADVRFEGTGVPWRVGSTKPFLVRTGSLKSWKPGMTREMWSRTTS